MSLRVVSLPSGRRGFRSDAPGAAEADDLVDESVGEVCGHDLDAVEHVAEQVGGGLGADVVVDVVEPCAIAESFAAVVAIAASYPMRFVRAARRRRGS